MQDLVFIGLDIGGANLKAVKLHYSGGKIIIDDYVRTYNPVWIRGAESIKDGLREIKEKFDPRCRQYYVAATMTAELSDVFKTKSEGVNYIVGAVEEVFSDSLFNYYVTVDKTLVSAREAQEQPLNVAAANWAASAWYLENNLSKIGYKDAVFIDIGSTTTTIIPLISGKAVVRGKSDPEKLVVGELVYTGVLRANVASIVDKVPYKGYFARVSFERFALTGDVHLVLNLIRREDYTTETADGRSTSLENAMARLSRVPCADPNMLNEEEVREMARYIYEAQIFRVFEALMQIRSWIASMGLRLDDFVAVVAGLGKYMAEEAARRAGFREVIDIDKLLLAPISSVFPAYATALMVYDRVVSAQV
jgi:hypothetical protein